MSLFNLFSAVFTVRANYIHSRCQNVRIKNVESVIPYTAHATQYTKYDMTPRVWKHSLYLKYVAVCRAQHSIT